MAQSLLRPLGALIVATRNGNTSNAAGFLAEFNAEGDKVLPRIEGDMSRNANLLHSAITNVRTNPRDMRVLESTRADLLGIR